MHYYAFFAHKTAFPCIIMHYAIPEDYAKSMYK